MCRCMCVHVCVCVCTHTHTSGLQRSLEVGVLVSRMLQHLGVVVMGHANQLHTIQNCLFRF